MLSRLLFRAVLVTSSLNVDEIRTIRGGLVKLRAGIDEILDPVDMYLDRNRMESALSFIKSKDMPKMSATTRNSRDPDSNAPPWRRASVLDTSTLLGMSMTSFYTYLEVIFRIVFHLFLFAFDTGLLVAGQYIVSCINSIERPVLKEVPGRSRSPVRMVDFTHTPTLVTITQISVAILVSLLLRIVELAGGFRFSIFLYILRIFASIVFAVYFTNTPTPELKSRRTHSPDPPTFGSDIIHTFRASN